MNLRGVDVPHNVFTSSTVTVKPAFDIDIVAFCIFSLHASEISTGFLVG